MPAAAVRGRGAAMFQLLLTIGLVLAAAIGLLVAHQVEQAAHEAPAALAVQDAAWRSIFWLSLAPGLLFTAGVVAGRIAALAAARGRSKMRCSLRRTRPAAEADAELAAIEGSAGSGAEGSAATRCCSAATCCPSCWPA
jgi:hypothetical protein